MLSNMKRRVNTISLKKKPTFRFVVISLAVLVISLLFSEIFGLTDDVNKNTSPPEVHTKDELSAILEKIHGVGKVSIYFHYAERTENKMESDLSFFQWTSDSKMEKEELIGILVVAEGASDKRIKNNLIKTLSSVLQISPHRIVIEEMELEDK